MLGKKVCLLLAFFVAVIAAVNGDYSEKQEFSIDGNNPRFPRAANGSHHLIIGSEVNGAKLLNTETVTKSANWQLTIELEQSFKSYGGLLTQIRAYDQKTDGTGATASFVTGGPGFNYVTLRFKSQRSHGIHFVVQLWGKVPSKDSSIDAKD